MGLVFSDDFRSYGSTAQLSRFWTGAVGSTWSWNATAGRNGGPGVTSTGASITNLVLPTDIMNVASGTAVGLCFWFKLSTAPSGNALIAFLPGAALTTYTGFGCDSSGRPIMIDSNGVVRQTGTASIADNNWHWCEIYDTGGNGTTFKCYIDTVQQWNAGIGTAGATTRNTAGFANVNTNSAVLTISMPILIDSTSPSPVASDIPLGPRQISTVVAASDAATMQFTPDTGIVGFSRINESSPDDDTSYIQDNVSGDTALFNLAALGFTPAQINAVNLKTVVRNPGNGTISFTNTLKSGATSSDGVSVVAPLTYAVKQTPYNQDPNTTAAWSPTNWANAQVGGKVV